MEVEDIENLGYEKTNWENWPSRKTRITAEKLMNIENMLERLCLAVNSHSESLKEYKTVANDVGTLKTDISKLKQDKNAMAAYISPSGEAQLIGRYNYKWLWQKTYRVVESNAESDVIKVDISDLIKNYLEPGGDYLEIVSVTGRVEVTINELNSRVVYPIGYGHGDNYADCHININEKKINVYCSARGNKRVLDLLVRYTTETE